MLERGGFYLMDRGDFDQREDNMMARVDGGRGLDTSRTGHLAQTYGNNVGGASVHYWADTWRTPKDRCDRWASEHGIGLRRRWGRGAPQPLLQALPGLSVRSRCAKERSDRSVISRVEPGHGCVSHGPARDLIPRGEHLEAWLTLAMGPPVPLRSLPLLGDGGLPVGGSHAALVHAPWG